ncbi:MAG: hypothetical protein ACYC7H_07060, partial [Chloroflexota bacterium]
MSTETIPTNKSDRTHLYRAARDRGVRWLLGHLNPDGALGDPAEGFFFYRAPWAFACAGETEAAAAVCGWIRRNMLTPRGTLEGPFCTDGLAYAYKNATLAVGAHIAQAYDLSHGLMADLLSWQDSVSGAFPDHLFPDGTKSDNMDVPFTCGVGFACLATGHLAAAH